MVTDQANSATIAYFSMEVGLEPSVPTYSGGLGVLAGDMLRAAADASAPMVGVTLLHRKGYFRQYLDRNGRQSESAVEWNPADRMDPQDVRAFVPVQGRQVEIRAWCYKVRGVTGYSLPVYFLDTDLPENEEQDRRLTDHLYGGDALYRLKQEVVLGMGGVAMLRALGHYSLQVYHMNEGHSALLALSLLEEQAGERRLTGVVPEDVDAVRRRCVFTTHTPVPAGHDRFPMDMVRDVIGEEHADALTSQGCVPDDTLNMTHLGLFFSRYVNGVSMRHEEVSRDMFPNHPINSITNGMHAATWASDSFREVFDRHISSWRVDNRYLRHAARIPLEEVQQAHRLSKQALFDHIEQKTGTRLDPGIMTIGFARRAATYKRADLLFTDRERLNRIAETTGSMQFVFAGKAHPRDEMGKDVIRRIFEASTALSDSIKIVYLQDYDMTLGRLLTSGVDLWLNTPQRPQEASGTSGMKAALNGVPSLSILDGWWVEGWVEGVTGWAIGDNWNGEEDPQQESALLYDKLEYVVLPMFYSRPGAYAEVMRRAIELNGSYFTAQRMLSQYLQNAYRAPHLTAIAGGGI
ncbi:MAG: alpha-glucan family phosphorylase [Dehalococcoidia bacterium]